MAAYQPRVSANYVPGGYDDSYYTPPAAPELISPEPQRHMPEMSNQIQHGLQNMSLDHRESVATVASDYQHEISHDYNRSSQQRQPEQDTRSFSPFPKPVNPPPNVPPSDDEFESTLWHARHLVLDSNDAEMQLAWAADALVYVGTCAEHEERIVAAKPGKARPGTPNIEHTLKDDAKNIITFLSQQHHPKAEFLRGMWLEWGRYGEREDKKEAFRCYSRAADNGYVRAEYRIGMLYESFNDATKALRHYHRGVAAGDSASCYRLGMMTLRGQHGQQQDYKRAIELIRQSAESADENAAQGAYVYGMLLAKQLPQIVVPEQFLQPDEAKAKTYIEKAAFLRFAKAQLRMGSSYELGAMGCNFDPALSMHYYALASKQGEAEADMALSKWFLVGHEGLFAKNEELAFTYAEQAAATGLATAEFAMGYFNEIGMCVPVNVNRSLEWYQSAAQHGNEDARGRIDALSKKQYLSKKDHEQVAITRIKSMHNSMRGGRPERLRQNQPTPMGRISESGSSQQLPLRAASVLPYPIDDRPPIVPTGRSSSAAPYPIHDASPTSAYPTSPGGRDWSASQSSRPATTTYGDQRLHAQQQRPAYGGGPPPAQQTSGDRRYGPVPTAGLSPRPGQGFAAGPNQRVVSSPAHLQQSSRPPQPSPRIGQYPQGAPSIPYQTQTPRPDMNYQAPYNDTRPRPGQQAPPQGRPYGQTPSSQSRPYDQGPPAQNRPYTQGPPQDRPSNSTLQQSSSAPNIHQMRTSSKPATPQQQQGRTPAPQPPTKDSLPSLPATPPKKQGPTTFEEMGVQSKKNEDCVVM